MYCLISKLTLKHGSVNIAIQLGRKKYARPVSCCKYSGVQEKLSRKTRSDRSPILNVSDNSCKKKGKSVRFGFLKIVLAHTYLTYVFPHT